MGGSIQPTRDKFYISIYWQGKQYRIFRHPVTLEPFYSKEAAKKQLSKIQTEIDEHAFNPASWLPQSPIGMSVYAHNWLEIIDVSKKTKQSYITAVKKYISAYYGNKDIRSIRYNDILLFQKWLSRTLKPKGIYNTIGVLKKLLRDAYRNQDITQVPPFPKLSYDLPEIEYLTMEQQDKILEAIPERHRPIFQCMMEYGVRPQEARALKRDCIKDGHIFIRRVFSDNTLRETTKTGNKGKRVFEITPYFRNVLASLDTSIVSQFVFVRDDGKSYTSKNLNAIWHEAEEKAGIKCKLYNATRHSLGCRLLDQGEDMDLVRQVLGHTKADMTRRYAKRKVSKITDALVKSRVVKFKKSAARMLNDEKQ